LTKSFEKPDKVLKPLLLLHHCWPTSLLHKMTTSW